MLKKNVSFILHKGNVYSLFYLFYFDYTLYSFQELYFLLKNKSLEIMVLNIELYHQ